MGFYEKGAQFGSYKSVVPSKDTYKGGTHVFQTPQTSRSLSQEVKEHFKIPRMFQHIAHYNKNMEQMMVELLRLKLQQQHEGKVGVGYYT